MLYIIFDEVIGLSKLLEDARAIWDAALKAVDPYLAVKNTLDMQEGRLKISGLSIEKPDGFSIAALGKASITMTRAALDIMGDKVSRCVVVHPDYIEWGDAPQFVKKIPAGHPIPNRGSLLAGKQLGEFADSLGAKDVLIFLISGGGSALAIDPVGAISFEDKAAANDALLKSGADIRSFNCVRKHISAIKGGRLAARAHPAQTISLIISDVVGDDPSVIASGPTAPDDSNFSEAFAACLKAKVPPSVMQYLERGFRGIEPESPKPGDPLLSKTHNIVIASNRAAIDMAGMTAQHLGYKTLWVTDSLEGEARVVGRRMAKLLKSAEAPSFIALGGETTVTVSGKGKGGRCQELALAAAIELDGQTNSLIWAAGTDGIDGPTDAAGAWVDGETIARAKRLGLNPYLHLSKNDSYNFFKPIEGLIHTGPTGTNVMDLIFLLKI